MSPHPRRPQDPGLGGFTRRVLVITLVAALAFAAWRLADIGLLLFAAVLIAIGLDTAASRLARGFGIGRPVCLAVAVCLLLAAFGGASWFFGTVIADQMDDVARQAPAGLRLALERLQSHPYGRFALDQAGGSSVTSAAAAWAASALGGVASGLARGLAYAVVTFFVAVYLAAQPELYRGLCLRLLPRTAHHRTRVLFARTADILRRWLLGQLVVMATIGTLSGAGLWALGIEAAFALGLLGGLLSFIPYVGAVLAAVPATLVALTQGPGYAAAVVLMYVGIHFVEGNFVTPLVQAEATSMPPVVALLSTVAFSILFGPSAVLLAAPLTLAAMVAVEVLWVQHALGEPPPPDGVLLPGKAG